MLEDAAHRHGLNVLGKYIENASGTRLDRVELQRLLSDAQPGEVLLVESVDRLSRLSQTEWKQLKDIIYAKGLRLVVEDLPTFTSSPKLMTASPARSWKLSTVC